MFEKVRPSSSPMVGGERLFRSLAERAGRGLGVFPEGGRYALSGWGCSGAPRARSVFPRRRRGEAYLALNRLRYVGRT